MTSNASKTDVRGDGQTLLVLGAGGMLGSRLASMASAAGWRVTALDRAGCDITDPAAIRQALAAGPDWVANCAAWTDVDGAEADEAGANRLNHHAAAELARAAAEANIPVAHVSTDYVFDGSGRDPYPPGHPVDPINAYGRTKAAGEAAVLAASPRNLVVRTAWLYDGHHRNFFTTIRSLAESRDRIEVVDDQHGRPTTTATLSDIMLRLMAAGASGIHHGCNAGQATWFDFASAIVEAAGLACEVARCGSDRYPRPARRPAWSVLDLDPTRAITGPIPHWREGLAAVLADGQDREAGHA